MDRTALNSTVIDTLVSERRRFLAFLVSRVEDVDTAEDLLQTGVLQALRRADSLRDDERVVAWIYRILRNVLTDWSRQRSAQGRMKERVGSMGLAEEVPPEVEEQLCACVGALLSTLPRDQAELLRLVELEEVTPSRLAERLGLTPGNARVRIHRARAALRARVEQACRTCARHGCVDCTCNTKSN